MNLITRAPDVLLVNLRRYRKGPEPNGELEKLDVHVHFKEMLDIQPYMDQRCMKSDGSTYRQVGIAQHIGNREGGQYIADNEIREASLQEVLSCEAYMLVYERCSTDTFLSSANVMGEESHLSDTDTWPKIGGPIYHSIPPPLDELGPWEHQRNPKRDKRREEALAKKDDIVAKEIWMFLDRHEELSQCLSTNLLMKIDDFGHGGNPIMIPIPDKCALVQGLIAHVLSKHRAGYSWEGGFGIDDMDVYDGKVVINRSPKLFEIHPKISHEMVVAMEKDFGKIVMEVLNKFRRRKTHVPYLKPFRILLGNIRRAYDAGDGTDLFKSLMETEIANEWTEHMKRTTNPLLLAIFRSKDPTPKLFYYRTELEFLFEYMRHLPQHGAERSFVRRPLARRGDGPRKQRLQSLDELELAGAYYLESAVVQALTILINSNAMKGIFVRLRVHATASSGELIGLSPQLSIERADGHGLDQNLIS
ncbi:Ubiquitin carboxyl-terminal hydrolase 2 [Panicum miliaceum]|uniref:Ubiquitin carboxyl-terminal hydrolase 2 n=1 Tax=Panicum miliaceum TaxID=4540 RepID=A0A3L6QXG0_PANMI|nr:Ubiquitin carboxyl-terminal hydrolase 2 [Panicum miliaceum]